MMLQMVPGRAPGTSRTTHKKESPAVAFKLPLTSSPLNLTKTLTAVLVAAGVLSGVTMSVAAPITSTPQNFDFAIHTRDDDRLIGLVSLRDIQWNHGETQVWLAIGAADDRGGGAAAGGLPGGAGL